MSEPRLSADDAHHPHLMSGFRLGRYELLAILAQGGMGTVWMARMRGQHGFERMVAVKTILPQFAEDKRFRRMFLDEARLASRIIHPNVVQVLDLGDESGVLYLVMEWVDGDSLRSLSRRIDDEGLAFPAGIAVRLVRDACLGLHAAHELCDENDDALGVVHRDISPHNILIDIAGTARVTDFGIAKTRNRLSPDTTRGKLKGKLRYMAPEQAMGEPVDHRADVWSMGAVLYELLTGQAPYAAEGELALLREITTSSPSLVFPEQLHPRIASVVRRALSRNRGARFATAEEFASELSHSASTVDADAHPDEVAAFCRKHLSAVSDRRRNDMKRAIVLVEQLNEMRDRPLLESPLLVPGDKPTPAKRPPLESASGSASESSHGEPPAEGEQVVTSPSRSVRRLATGMALLGLVGLALLARLSHRSGSDVPQGVSAIVAPPASSVPSPVKVERPTSSEAAPAASMTPAVASSTPDLPRLPAHPTRTSGVAPVASPASSTPAPIALPASSTSAPVALSASATPASPSSPSGRPRFQDVDDGF